MWKGSDGNDYEIFIYDIATGTTSQLSDNEVDDWSPRVSGGLVAWESGVSNLFVATRDLANLVPLVSLSPSASLNEGEVLGTSGSFTDADSSSWTATVDYGDGSGVQALALASDKNFSLSHLYPQDGNYIVTVSVTDNDGATGSDTLSLEVSNVSPTVDPDRAQPSTRWPLLGLRFFH